MLKMRYLKQRDVKHGHGHAVIEGAGIGVTLEAMFPICLLSCHPSSVQRPCGMAAVAQLWRDGSGVPSISVAS